MAAYLVTTTRVTDPKLYEEYRRQVPATIAKFSGRFRVRGGSELLEGDWQPQRLVVIEFRAWQPARAWYRSPDYSPLIALRQRGSTGTLVAVEGV